jgi:hypothetical protein
MGQLDVSLQTEGVVHADAEPVMRWWLHSDRRAEFLSRLETNGAIRLSFDETVLDGVRHRTFQWTDKRSWKHRHDTESPIRPDGSLPGSFGDRFVVPTKETRTYTSPIGGKITSTCEGRIEFVPRTADTTDVVVLHSQLIISRSKKLRQSVGKSERANTESQFQEMIEKCRLAIVQGPPRDSDLVFP